MDVKVSTDRRGIVAEIDLLKILERSDEPETKRAV